MKILLFKGDETLEEFEKISDAIIQDLVNLRGRHTDDGQCIWYSIDELHRNDTGVEIALDVHRVKCSHRDDF